MIFIAQFCFSCGNALDGDTCTYPRCKKDKRRYCEKCGTLSVDGIVFCLNCGGNFAEMAAPTPYTHAEGNYLLTQEDSSLDSETERRGENQKVKKPPLIVMSERNDEKKSTSSLEKTENTEDSELEIENESISGEDEESSFDFEAVENVIQCETELPQEPEVENTGAVFAPKLPSKKKDTMQFDIFVPEEKKMLAFDRILTPSIEAVHIFSKPNVFALNTVDGYGGERG